MPVRRLVRLGLSRRGICRVGLAVAMLGAVPWSGPASAGEDAAVDSAKRFVAAAHADLREALRSEAASAAARRDAVAAVLSRSMAVESVARLVLGDAATDPDPVEWDRFLTLFPRQLAGRFIAYHADHPDAVLKIIGGAPMRGDDVLVRAELAGPADRVQVLFRTSPHHTGAWRMMDVVVDGASWIVTSREEFRAVLARDGLAGLNAALAATAP